MGVSRSEETGGMEEAGFTCCWWKVPGLNPAVTTYHVLIKISAIFLLPSSLRSIDFYCIIEYFRIIILRFAATVKIFNACFNSRENCDFHNKVCLSKRKKNPKQQQQKQTNTSTRKRLSKHELGVLGLKGRGAVGGGGGWGGGRRGYRLRAGDRKDPRPQRVVKAFCYC